MLSTYILFILYYYSYTVILYYTITLYYIYTIILFYTIILLYPMFLTILLLYYLTRSHNTDGKILNIIFYRKILFTQNSVRYY